MKNVALLCPLVVSIYICFAPPQSIPALVDSLPKSLLKWRERIYSDKTVRQQCNSWSGKLDKTWFSLSFILCTSNFKGSWNIHPGTEVAGACQESSGGCAVRIWSCGAHRQNKTVFLYTSCKGTKLFPYWNSGQILEVSQPALCGQRETHPEVRGPWKGPPGCVKSASRSDFYLWLQTQTRDFGFLSGSVPISLAFKPVTIQHTSNSLGCGSRRLMERSFWEVLALLEKGEGLYLEISEIITDICVWAPYSII